jgi:hypothetical protein
MINKILAFFSATGAILLFFAGKQNEKNKQTKRAIKSVKAAKKVQSNIDTMPSSNKRKRMHKKYSRSGESKS